MDDEDIGFSAETLKALREFSQEQMIRSVNEEYFPKEDWELSQFWYDEETSKILAQAALEAVNDTKNQRIVCISCPSVYEKLRKISTASEQCYLFEYDKRFHENYPESFVFYDYKDPLELDEKFRNYFDLVIADPPFLSEECLEKFAKTISILTNQKIVLCTGAVMEDLAKKYLNVYSSSFIPKHERKLGNEFKCYANFNFDVCIEKSRAKIKF